MSNTTTRRPSGLSHMMLFFALSRTPHGILDMATPALGALLWLGAFPPAPVILIGLLTAFAGYTAVYALNDLIDYRVDKVRVGLGQARAGENYLDDVLIRHPMARGLLSLREGLFWTAAWSVVALVGAYLLNPVCVIIFVGGCLLEAIYCLLLKVSHLRTLVSGGVKTTGAIAAVFAIDPAPDWRFLILLFSWLFFWEVGGQNIPHDWADVEEDRRLDTQTIPVRFGPGRATRMILICLVLSVLLSTATFLNSPVPYELPFLLAVLSAGILGLILPASRLYTSRKQADAMSLFNRASYFPLWLLGIVLLKLVYDHIK